MQIKDLQLKRALRSVLLVLLLSAVGMGKGYAYDATIGDLMYDLNDNTLKATVTGHKNHTHATGNLTIPSTVSFTHYGVTRTYTVTAIRGYDGGPYGSGAFEGCSGLTGDLVIPNTVTTIGNYAFYRCSGFSGNLTIPNSVTTIGNFTFYDCNGFSGDLTIGNSLYSIGYNAFRGCSNFNTITVATGNSVFDSRENCNALIKTSTNELILGSKNSVIPESVTSICDHAFFNCAGLTGSLTIPNSVISIGEAAFAGCSGLTEVYYNAISCSDISWEWEYYHNSGPFYDCTGTLVVSENVERIPEHMFDYAAFTEVQYNAINCEDNLAAFVSCEGTLIIGENVERIPNSIFSGAGFSGDLIIPENVTSIGKEAFYNCNGFTGNLVIPSSMTSIGGGAFYCYSFTEVHYNAINCSDMISDDPNYYHSTPFICVNTLVIGENVERIPSYMFKSVAFSGDLIIPESVTSIGEEAFYNCTGFTGDLVIPNSVTSVGEYAFAGCSGFSGNLTIGNSVTSIGGGAFTGCSGILEVHYNAINCSDINSYVFPFQNIGGLLVISENVQRIPKKMFIRAAFTEVQYNAINCANISFEYTTDLIYPFQDCEGVLVLGNNVERIPSFMFYGASFVGDLVIPNSVTSIGGSAFYGCSGFTGSLTIPNSVTTIGGSAFSSCSGFTGSLTIPNSVTTISGSAFYGCSGFTGTLAIPNSVTAIGGSAFSWCSGFTGSLTIPNSVTTIGDYAFSGCNGFTGSLTIPNSVTTIGYDAFTYCSGFTGSLTIPNTVTTLGGSAFSGCSGFTGSLTLSNSLTSIGNYTFYNCSGFTGNLTISNSVTSIGNSAFEGCSGFTGNLAIPNSVTSIGNSAFHDCSGFTGSLTIGNFVTSIGNTAFEGCNGLTSITVLAETPPTIQSNTFYNVPKSIPVHVPCGSLATYQSADYWNEFTNIQESCTASQAIILSAGWNWFSANVGITLDDLKDALVEAFPGATISINSQSDGSTSYIGNTWRGTLTALDPTQMYMISVSAEGEITLEGLPINPTEQSITIHPDFNWFVFPLSQSMTLTDAFAGFAVNGDMVISQDEGSSTYTNRWRGTLETLEPGKGYMYKSNDNEVKIFVFPSVR